AENVAGDLAGDVDVESGDLTGDRVTEAEQVAADVQSDDQPAARTDVSHRGIGQLPGGEGAQAGRRITVLTRGVWRQRGFRRQLLHAHGGGRWQRRHGGHRQRFGVPATGQQNRDGEHPAHPPGPAQARHQRYSFSRGHRPSATAMAAPRLSTTPPTCAPDSPLRALRTSLRRWVRLWSMALPSWSSSLSKAGVESSSPLPRATWVAAR